MLYHYNAVLILIDTELYEISTSDCFSSVQNQSRSVPFLLPFFVILADFAPN